MLPLQIVEVAGVKEKAVRVLVTVTENVVAKSKLAQPDFSAITLKVVVPALDKVAVVKVMVVPVPATALPLVALVVVLYNW